MPAHLRYHDEQSLSNLRQTASLNVDWLLKAASASPEVRAALAHAYTRRVVKLALMAFRPGIEVLAFQACEAGRENDALDTIEAALVELYSADPFLFEPVPTRDEAYKVALAWLGEKSSPIGTDRRSYLWSNYADQMDSVRHFNTYKFKHEIAESKSRGKPRDFPHPAKPSTVRSGAIGGGPQVAAQTATDQHAAALAAMNEIPAKIGGQK